MGARESERDGRLAGGAGNGEAPPADQLRRTRERIGTLGPRVLSAAELVAVLLAGIAPGTGPGLDESGNLLREFSPSDAQALRRIMAAQLATIAGTRGLGTAPAAVLLAALELGRRAVEEGRAEADRFRTAADVFAYLHPTMRDLPRESFRVLLLDHECRLRQEVLVGQHRAGVDSAVNLQDAFRVGIAGGACGLVLVQNHPCGDPSPTPLDRVITRSFKDGCVTLGLVPHDHIIIGDGRYFSASEADTVPGWYGGLRSAPVREIGT